MHLSDIQAENYGSREKNLVSIVNSENPDIILITGDIFNTPYKYNTGGFKAAIKILDQLKTKYGIFIVEGHHDEQEAYHIVEALPGKIKLLKDEEYHRNDQDISFSIFGASLYSKKNDFPKTITSNNFRIFIAHNPNITRNIRAGDFDLALFGHTHASQVYLPIVSQTIVGKYIHGRYDHEGIPVYINAGVGLEGYLSPRIRWFTFPEVVVINLLPN